MLRGAGPDAEARRDAPRQLRQRDRPPRLVLYSPATTQQCSLEDRKQGQPGGRLAVATRDSTEGHDGAQTDGSVRCEGVPDESQ